MTLGIDVTDGVASFVDKSLVRRDDTPSGEPRFRMLETIREYAREQLAISPDADEIPRRHGEYFADLAERGEPELLGPRQVEWLDRMEAERDNLRAAMHWAAGSGHVERALSMAGALWRFWQQRAHLAEGHDELTALVSRPDAAGHTPGRAKALTGLGGVTYWQGDFEAATRAYQEAVDIERRLDDPPGLADALYNLGFVDMISSRMESAQALYQESLAVSERIGDRTGMIKVREALAFFGYLQKEYASALALELENLRAFRELGEPFRIGNSLTLVSLFNTKVGDFNGSRAALAEAMAIFRAAGDIQGIVNALLVGAFALMAEGHADRTAELEGGIAVLREPLGEVATSLDILGIEDPSIEARRILGEEAYAAAAARGRTLDLDSVIRLAFEVPQRA